MNSIFEELYECLKSNQTVVLATVVETGGSTPRGAGARMFIKKNGELIGTIGGGQVEYLVAQDAKSLFETRKPMERFFGLEKGGNAAMTCGGKVRVILQYIEANENNVKLYQEICLCIRKQKNSWISIDLSDLNNTKLSVDTPLFSNCNVRKPMIFKKENQEYYTEMVSAKTAFYVFGAGHVGQEMVSMMSRLGYRTVIVDPRKELANRDLFPTADEIYTIPYSRISEILSITDQDYVVVMTNTHHSDLEVMKQVLKSRPFYLGMMGSKKKISFITESLLEAGFSQEEINRCHMPIGMNIMAETPAEIAVSVAAQIIQYRARYW